MAAAAALLMQCALANPTHEPTHTATHEPTASPNTAAPIAPTDAPTVGIDGVLFASELNFVAMSASKVGIILITIVLQHTVRWLNAYFSVNDMEEYINVAYKISLQVANFGFVLFVAFIAMQTPVGVVLAPYSSAVQMASLWIFCVSVWFAMSAVCWYIFSHYTHKRLALYFFNDDFPAHVMGRGMLHLFCCGRSAGTKHVDFVEIMEHFGRKFARKIEEQLGHRKKSFNFARYLEHGVNSAFRRHLHISMRLWLPIVGALFAVLVGRVAFGANLGSVALAPVLWIVSLSCFCVHVAIYLGSRLLFYRFIARTMDERAQEESAGTLRVEVDPPWDEERVATVGEVVGRTCKAMWSVGAVLDFLGGTVFLAEACCMAFLVIVSASEALCFKPTLECWGGAFSTTFIPSTVLALAISSFILHPLFIFNMLIYSTGRAIDDGVLHSVAGEMLAQDRTLLAVLMWVDDSNGGDLDRAFRLLDRDGDRTISRDELREGFNDLGMRCTQTEFNGLWRRVNPDQAGDVDLDEFEAILVDMRAVQLAELEQKAAEQHSSALSPSSKIRRQVTKQMAGKGSPGGSPSDFQDFKASNNIFLRAVTSPRIKARRNSMAEREQQLLAAAEDAVADAAGADAATMAAAQAAAAVQPPSLAVDDDWTLDA